jgi:hypothetical protein
MSDFDTNAYLDFTIRLNNRTVVRRVPDQTRQVQLACVGSSTGLEQQWIEHHSLGAVPISPETGVRSSK